MKHRVILVVTLILMTIIPNAVIAATLGDVNLDGVVNNGDAVMIMQSVDSRRELTQGQLLLGEVNGDGVVDGDDANIIMQARTKLMNMPQPPTWELTLTPKCVVVDSSDDVMQYEETCLVYVGERVKCECDVTGGSGNYSYKYALYKQKEGGRDEISTGTGAVYEAEIPSRGLFNIELTITDETLDVEKTYKYPVALEALQIAQSIELDRTSAAMKVGETLRLTATVQPTDTNNPAISWLSDNIAVASVDSQGRVKAEGAGSCNITAINYASDKKADCAVTVSYPELKITSITRDRDIAYIDDIITWNANITGGDGNYSTRYTLLTGNDVAHVNFISTLLDETATLPAVGIGSTASRNYTFKASGQTWVWYHFKVEVSDRSGNKATGWADAISVRPKPFSEYTIWIQANGGINVRDWGSTDASRIGGFKNGQAVTVTGAQSGDWLPVRGTNDDNQQEVTGWIAAQYTTATNPYDLVVRNEYPYPIKCYLRDGESTWATTAGIGENSTGSIYDSDEVTIHQIYTNGWCSVEYPTPSGSRTAFCLARGFINDVNYSAWQASHLVNNDIKVASRPGWDRTFGTMFATDTVYIVGDNGDWYQAIFNVSGGWKMGWAPKSEFRENAPYTEWTGYVTTASGLNLRSGPGTGYSVYALMPYASEFSVIGDGENGFYKVRYNSTEGYASKNYISNIRPEPDPDPNPVVIIPDGTLAEKLDALRRKFPNGTYWCHPIGTDNNPDGYMNSPCPCTKHGGDHSDNNLITGNCGCNSFGNAIQCMGFAKKIGNELFGTTPSDYSNWGVTDSIYNARPGDYVRYGNHSVIIIGVDGDYISVVDCNWSGKCQIQWDRVIAKSKIQQTLKYIYTHP